MLSLQHARCLLLLRSQSRASPWGWRTATAFLSTTSPATASPTSQPSHADLTLKEIVAQIPDGLGSIPQSRVRNFSVIAHIDHGKSTLSDCLLELTGNITSAEKKAKAQYTDTLKVERERGITVKAQTASMVYRHPKDGKEYLLNLVDTPGHVDFAYEVSRSLSACQGALLLVDATQGIQAQTLSTYAFAQEAKLSIIPVVTKSDLPHAQTDDVTLQMATTFDMDLEDVLVTSAKTGQGVHAILPAVIDRISAPGGDPTAPLRARLIDSWYDPTRGVVCLVQVVDGSIKENDRISAHSLAAFESFSVQEVGVLCPYQLRTGSLLTGQVGYVIAGMRSTRQAKMGDTIYHHQKGAAEAAEAGVDPLPGFETAKSMLFASIYPLDTQDFDSLELAVNKLTLNDASVTVQREGSNTSLGSGLRCGFLGLLHMEVFNQRLRDEFGTAVLLTSPTVPYRIIHSQKEGETAEVKVIQTLADWPDPATTPNYRDLKIEEPVVEATILTPVTSVGAITTCLKERRGVQEDVKYLDDKNVVLTYRLPWQEVVTDLHDVVKNVSAGYASLNYKEAGYASDDLVKVELALNGEEVDALSFVCHRTKAEREGRRVALKLKNVIDRQNFEINIQAKVGRKVVARERVAPYRKDVLVTKAGKNVGGGDVTRKKKLLEKQKQGKKRAKMVGKVSLSQEAFWAVISKD
ncbi:gtp binding protein [Nannochloropsis gaditana]|uniref:Translation factor GUF1 homolog, mitochondrial n=1 Tax=Nannochloropsis gaditana TaxID=72520 RepID=W7TE65_9STRA|nr:gtp binding protein [Nannochloropsis gaditana]